MKKILLAYLFLAGLLNAAPPQGASRESIDQRVARLQERLGDSYKVRSDEERKIVILSDLPGDTIDGYFSSLRRYQDALHATFFEHPPDYWILVLIPGNVDDYNKKLGGNSSAAGFYDSRTRTLTVNIATGNGTMVHEWTHALNIADQTALGQSQPLWILEGFGSLFEQVGIRDTRPVGFTNWRLPQIHNMIRGGSLNPMRDFIMNSSKYFEKDAVAAYAQTRYIFYYLQEKDLLQKFYRTYVARYAEDRTGIVALETVLGKKVEEWVDEWKDFTLDLTFGNVVARPQMGVQLDATGGRLRVIRIVEGSAADKAGVLTEDVIVGVDEQTFSAVDDLQKFLAGKKRKDVITLRVTRNGMEKDFRITLQ